MAIEIMSFPIKHGGLNCKPSFFVNVYHGVRSLPMQKHWASCRRFKNTVAHLEGYQQELEGCQRKLWTSKLEGQRQIEAWPSRLVLFLQEKWRYNTDKYCFSVLGMGQELWWRPWVPKWRLTLGRTKLQYRSHQPLSRTPCGAPIVWGSLHPSLAELVWWRLLWFQRGIWTKDVTLQRTQRYDLGIQKTGFPKQNPG